MNQPVGEHLLETGRKTWAEEIQPIDDIRSTAAYRIAVLANLLGEFLRELSGGTSTGGSAR